MDPFIGMIVMFGGNFAPRNWAFCDGQLLAIASNTALFSILGTIYGGDGRTTFGLPDLRGRNAVHAGGGAGPGLAAVPLGQKGGTTTHTLNVTHLPSHNHALNVPAQFASSRPTHTNGATGLAPANGTGFAAAAGATGSTGNIGGNQPVNHQDPYQAVNYIIALFGFYPSRS